MAANVWRRGSCDEMAQVKKDWTLSPGGFHQFLNWLDAGVDSHGESYLEMRRRLSRYFDFRNCPSPDELADETLTRVARTLEEKGEITGTAPAQYCYIVARFVLLETIRRNERTPASLDASTASGRAMASLAAPSQTQSDAPAKEKLFHCLERCLGRLLREDRDLILEYYRGERREKINRRAELARRFGLSMNALSIRACRIRDKLELCVDTCCKTT